MLYYIMIRDAIEIFCYAFILYTFCTWLKADKTKNILPYFLGYCIAIIASWALEFPTLPYFLLSYAPAILVIFIILHEKLLQRNFVALNTHPVQATQDWLDIVLSSALTTINNNKSITVVIENKDSLEYFLTTDFFINAPINKDILAILLSCTSYDEQKMLWINSQGLIRSINTVWYKNDQEKQVSSRTIFDKTNALFYSLQCDAIIIHNNPFTRQFTIILNGKELSNISVAHIKNVIKQHLSANVPIKNKGLSRENNSTQTTSL